MSEIILLRSRIRKTFGVSPTLYRRNHWEKSGKA